MKIYEDACMVLLIYSVMTTLQGYYFRGMEEKILTMWKRSGQLLILLSGLQNDGSSFHRIFSNIKQYNSRTCISMNRMMNDVQFVSMAW